jgi:ArsR family metal-binding transcriptional regulator
MKIRTQKNEQFIRQFAFLNEGKETMMKEKRRIQEQLRRIKKNEAKGQGHGPVPGAPPKKKKIKLNQPEPKVKCGACGQVCFEFRIAVFQ